MNKLAALRAALAVAPLPSARALQARYLTPTKSRGTRRAVLLFRARSQHQGTHAHRPQRID